ncbi:hypothetical protein PoB_002553700 [Plakobranchus ocellatus]|uniref:Uncharacterized protein n=1 Tax=Plakobranchus ocellatus TaxID=259542 RepID=A0AAV3ZVC2_9GAST|nr:hypothetical protein PoB_002553700 [Plakobranchus ocellatus]
MKELGVGGAVASESALKSAGTLLSRVRTLLPTAQPDGGPKPEITLLWNGYTQKVKQSMIGNLPFSLPSAEQKQSLTKTVPSYLISRGVDGTVASGSAL